jgi:hypothetical protein
MKTRYSEGFLKLQMVNRFCFLRKSLTKLSAQSSGKFKTQEEKKGKKDPQGW